jgi:hypothetical protein
VQQELGAAIAKQKTAIAEQIKADKAKGFLDRRRRRIRLLLTQAV